ncbi:hypothetical protein VV1062A_03382 [Vibrio vulnificus]|nr:hypothetical protein VV1062A_03382 [Vibrio vulnificus]OJI53823.1 hypothetical protein VFL11327_04454 [Vibrio fluvialis]
MKRFLLAVVLFCPLLANAENAPKIIEDGFDVMDAPPF